MPLGNICLKCEGVCKIKVSLGVSFSSFVSLHYYCNNSTERSQVKWVVAVVGVKKKEGLYGAYWTVVISFFVNWAFPVVKFRLLVTHLRLQLFFTHTHTHTKGYLDFPSFFYFSSFVDVLWFLMQVPFLFFRWFSSGKKWKLALSLHIEVGVRAFHPIKRICTLL